MGWTFVFVFLAIFAAINIGLSVGAWLDGAPNHALLMALGNALIVGASLLQAWRVLP